MTRKILPQGPSAWTKKRSFKKKGLKIPFPRLSQCAFKRIQFCDLYSFSPAFLAAMKFVSNRSEIDKCNQVTGLQMIYKFLFQEIHIIRPCQRVSRRKNVSLKLLSCPLHSDWVVKLVIVNKNLVHSHIPASIPVYNMNTKRTGMLLTAWVKSNDNNAWQ